MKTLRVLAVDDEEAMLSGIERTLRDFVVAIPEVGEEVDFEVVLTGTGEDAVSEINRATPDILLLDYKLPKMTGLDVLREIGTVKEEFLTIMITAYASIQTAVQATKQGAYDFLPKPFTPANLRHSVRKASAQIMLAREARRLAEERRRVRFDFIRVLGHELKAPLGAVSTHLGIMKGRYLGEEIEAYDELIERCTLRLDQMQKLIVDLLDMTRIESGQKKRVIETVDLKQAALDAIDLAASQAAERSISIHLAADDRVALESDRGEIDMILNNLISNAVKYNRDGGRVDVVLTKDDEEICVEVRDTGIGMTPEEVKKLFGEFVRIRNKKTKNLLGSGLGLSILKRLAELYGGRIEVESEPDVGTTFRAYLRTDVPPEATMDDMAAVAVR